MNAELHIQVAGRKGYPYLKKSFFTTPFKVMNITEDKAGKQLHLMLMSSSPGILDGDEYNIKIEVEKDASLQLHTQAYQRLFNMKLGAVQQMNVHLADGASFTYLPHPSVPHEQSIFTSRNNFYLGNNCQMIFGEILTCGRKLNGELFLFSRYHSVTNIYINNKLMIKENLLMQPALVNVHAIGQLEGFTHQASMLWIDQDADVKNIQQQLMELLSAEINMEAGITAAPVNGLIIRLLGNGAEQLYDCLKRVKQHLQTKVFTIPSVQSLD
jgi:urease accessory protein